MKSKLTEELIEVMCGLKAKGMHNKDICMAVGSMRQRFIGG